MTVLTFPVQRHGQARVELTDPETPSLGWRRAAPRGFRGIRGAPGAQVNLGFRIRSVPVGHGCSEDLGSSWPMKSEPSLPIE